jgi:DNA repair protein RadA/Sms
MLPASSAEMPKGGSGRWTKIEDLPDLVSRIAGSVKKLGKGTEDD